MTQGGAPTATADQQFRNRVQFGIWSDGPVAAEELQHRLTEHGQQAVITNGDRDTLIECLVALTRNAPTSAERAVLTKLANRATMTIAVEVGPDSWPRDVSLRWTGQMNDLTMLASDLMNLVRPAGPVFSRLPMLARTEDGAGVATSHDMLVERLSGRVRPRVVPVSGQLWDELTRPRKAVNSIDYNLRQLARWTGNKRSRSFVNLRLARRDDLTVSLTRPQSLDAVLSDPRTRPLVMLLGEPSSGKSLQLRYYEAHAALRWIEHRPGPDGPAMAPTTFYVALADHPSKPNISLDWLRQRWRAEVDVARWCDFDQFLADGGTVLLDGLNEGGVRGLEPEEWMSQWRDVIQELFERGAAKVVVSCRTRDQAIRMNVPRDRQPTSVTILPLSQDEIIAIATERDVAMARRLDSAFKNDPGLVELYSSPVRVQSYLESGAPRVATTTTRLFGSELSAAIIREWDHDKQIRGAQPGVLEDIAQRNGDPWPALQTIPLIRGLGQLAKALTLPASPDGQAPLAMSPGEAGEFLASAINRVVGQPVKAHDALETAKDLDVVRIDRGKIRFTHPSVQHLFAAIACSLDDLVRLAEQERDRVSEGGAEPVSGGPPSYAQHRYDELFHFAAHLRGVDVPVRLLAVDPVLAARVFIAIRHEVPDDVVRDRVITSLRSQLDKVFVPAARAGILAALGDLNWALPSAGEVGRGATMLVPAGSWHLGRHSDGEHAGRSVNSEVRTIALAKFRISRFPVSNVEYDAFIKDEGYHDQTLWSAEGWQWRTRNRDLDKDVAEWRRRQNRLRQNHPANTIRLLREKKATPAGAAALVRFANMTKNEMFEYARALQDQPVTAPRFWHEKPLRNALQPVVGVSWFEANAFCSWLGRRLGAVVRLPSESEWEAACLYSWGVSSTAEIDDALPEKFGNTLDLHWPATTPIGAFAKRDQARRELAVEMLGNVFEWVFDYYAPGDHNRRIVKGGSWQQESWRAHPAYRGRGDVQAQNEDVGFRYVVTEGSA